MIEKIISSGISGCELDVLKIAKKYRIPTLGYTSLILENGEIPDYLGAFNLKFIENEELARLKNIELSHGVLWISDTDLPSDEYLDCKEFGFKKGVSFLRVVMDRDEIYKKCETARDWIIEKGISSLMVTPDMDSSRENSTFVSGLIESLLYMTLIKTNPTGLASPIHVKAPDYKSGSHSVDSVVGDLVKTIPLKDRVIIGNMARDELYEVFPALGVTILSKYYWPANNLLKEDCLRISDSVDLEEFEVAEIIIVKLWEKLKETHKLRVIRE